jgi:hypothetical protein
MRATHRIIGCILCLAFAGSAAAASLGAPEVDDAPHAVTGPSLHDSSNSDAIGLSRDSSSVASDPAPASSNNGSDRPGAASSAPTRASRPHLGWQSLLPGSIQ